MNTRSNQLSRRRGGSRRRNKSRRRGGSESRRLTQSRRRGGSFYPYNTKPMIFTNTTTQQGGDSRDTLFPSFLTNMGRDAAYQVAQTYNAFAGNYSSTNPDPTHQNLFKR